MEFPRHVSIQLHIVTVCVLPTRLILLLLLLIWFFQYVFLFATYATVVLVNVN